MKNGSTSSDITVMTLVGKSFSWEICSPNLRQQDQIRVILHCYFTTLQWKQHAVCYKLICAENK